MSDETASCACTRVALDGSGNKYPGGGNYEVHRCVDCGARFMRAALWNPAREQTAATVLAALIQAHASDEANSGHGTDIPDSYVSVAVKWTAALRAELAKERP